MKVRGLAALMLLGAGAAVAEPVAFGTRTLEIPAPEGFVASAQEVPAFLELSQGFLPPGNRLVEIYVDPADLDRFRLPESDLGAPRLERYYQVQVPRRVDGTLVSNEEFTSGTATMEAELEQVMGNIDGMVSDLTTQGERKLEDRTGEKIDLDIGEVRYLGVFRREPWALFFTIASHVQVDGADGDSGHSGPMISAAAMALVNHQIVLLYAYAEGDDDATRSATEASLSNWVDRVRAANPDDPGIARQASKSGFNIASIGRGALIGALCGALIGLFAWFKRRRGS
jgi:hypothetical protein